MQQTRTEDLEKPSHLPQFHFAGENLLSAVTIRVQAMKLQDFFIKVPEKQLQI